MHTHTVNRHPHRPTHTHENAYIHTTTHTRYCDTNEHANRYTNSYGTKDDRHTDTHTHTHNQGAAPAITL